MKKESCRLTVVLRGGSGTPLPQWLVVDKVNDLELIDLLCTSIGFDLLYLLWGEGGGGGEREGMDGELYIRTSCYAFE